MTFLLLLLTVSLLLTAGSIRALVRDPRGFRPPPRSHAEDLMFRPPTA